jgi:Lon protease (S16) C-terminal proteolytic domain
MRFSALIAHVQSAKSPGDRCFRRATLERAFLVADPGAATVAECKAARSLGVPQSSIDGLLGGEAPAHAVHVPLVLHSGAAFVRLMHASGSWSGHRTSTPTVDASAARAVQDALQRAADRMRPEQPHPLLFATVHPEALSTLVGALAIRGPSLGAGAFVSACSLWSGRAVRAGTVITGRLVGERIADVGALEAKLDAIVQGRADLKRVIVPHDSVKEVKRRLQRSAPALEVHGVATLDELLDAALEPTSNSAGDIRYQVIELRRAFERGWQNFGWYALRERAERLITKLPAQRADLRAEVLGMLGAAQEHVGSPLAAAQKLDEAARLAESEANRAWIPDAVFARLYQAQSMTLMRLARFGEARRAAREAVAAARRAKLRDESFKAYGCLSIVERAAGRGASAVQAAERSLELVHAHAPESCSRTHGYLLEALALGSDLGRIHDEFRSALEHMPAGRGNRGHYEAWLRQSYAGALVRHEQWAAAIDALESPSTRDAIARKLQPGLLLRRYLGCALCHAGRASEGYRLLADSVDAYGTVLEPSLTWSAQLNVLYEAAARVQNGDWNTDAEGRARLALTAVPTYLYDERLADLRRDAEHALGTAALRPAAARTALQHLLALCSRIA